MTLKNTNIILDKPEISLYNIGNKKKGDNMIDINLNPDDLKKWDDYMKTATSDNWPTAERDPKAKISVLQEKVQEIKKRLTKLNKKLTKKGLPGMTIDVSSPYDSKIEVRDPEDYRGTTTINLKYVDLTIHHEIPILKESGYKFLATVSHKHGTKTIFNNSDDNFYNKDIDFKKCDHCNIKRDRNIISFFRKAETNEIVQIGSTCVKEYFGLDLVSALVAGCGFINYLNEGDFGSLDANRWNDTLYFNKLLAASILVLRHDKRYIPTNTANSVSALICDHIKGNTPILRDYLYSDDSDWKEVSDKIYTHWSEIEPSNDFEFNVKTRFVDRNIRSEALIACGAFALLKPEFEVDKDQEEVSNRVNEHIGTKGDTLEANIHVIKEIPYNGYYGPGTVIVMLTDTGHTLKWFTSTHKLVLNDEKRIKFTVKDHSIYNGYKDTVIARAKII